ncbi:hypothetical protein SAMN04244579_02162 [Azotobacter beijerinckii]|uniref:Uncharacterized protein n=1 Tax=Azotobacter beijerinckii TaxID=170623 RepID=A0A1H6U4D5_9GAMM|nr:hypothetical protein [Azotobacter beijerinckii]SEI83260.1 hypothetical protein SAMN04244579_02162 [Azotobacter beijerinckii]
MTVLIRLDANFPNSTLPKLVPVVAGFSKLGLQGLYLFEEGENGQAHSGTFQDSSGNGKHASLRGNWLQPTKQAYGMQAAAGGLGLNTGIPIGQKITIVMAARFNEPDPATNVYPTIFGAAAALAPTIGASANLSSGKGLINAQLIPGTGSPTLDGDWGVYRYGGVVVGDSTVRKSFPGSAGHANSPALIGFTYDATTGFLLAKHSGGEFRTTQAAALFAADGSDSVSFGLMQGAASHALAAGGEIYLAAVYADSSETLLDEVMAAARVRLEARGVSPLF